jgi:hypothetical protein
MGGSRQLPDRSSNAGHGSDPSRHAALRNMERQRNARQTPRAEMRGSSR